ncbi:hypothetical protein PPYR_07074 [Photinus pyralis]|nr:hypothetical protein PPYR_06659 [Photinus pyralis]KAB0799194.1 hypothetical protein PPYR_07074 [Photinus pyralis]
MSNQIIVFIFAVLTLFSAVVGEIITFDNCATNKDKCTIHEVRMDPCKEAAAKKPCKVKKGKPGSIEIDYTPHFDSDTLTGTATYLGQLLPNMETNACLTSPCPVVSGNKQTYTYQLLIDRIFPSGIFDVHWTLTGQNEGDHCCVSTKIFLK